MIKDIVLIVLWVLLNVGDFWISWKCWDLGMEEQFPIQRWLLKKGRFWVGAVKVVWVGGVLFTVIKWEGIGFLWYMNSLILLVVLWNWYQLRKRRNK